MKTTIVNIFLQTTIVFLTVVVVDSKYPLSHGSKCSNPSDWCDYSKWIWCNEQTLTCSCLHPSRQIFDQSQNRCVGLIGTECNAYVGNKDCAGNGICDWNYGRATCKCEKGYGPQIGRRFCIKQNQPYQVDDLSNDLDSDFGRVSTSTRATLPIYQYHQQRLGNINYRYSTSSTPKSTSNEKEIVGYNTLEESIDVNEGWRRFWRLLLGFQREGIPLSR